MIGGVRTEPAFPALLAVAVGAGAVGIVVISRFGSDRLGDPDRCEGLGFGCSPSTLEGVIRLSLLLGVLLLGAAVVARLVKRRRLVVLAGGAAMAAVATSLAWSATAITYPTPGLTEAEGRQRVESILRALREAAGPGDPARVPVSGSALAEAARVAQAPTLADVLAGVAATGPERCLDRSDNDSGSVQFMYTRKANVIAPAPTPLVAPSADQVERVIAALTAAGFDVGTPNRYAYPEKAAVFVDGFLAGPPPLRQGDGTFARDFAVRLTALVEKTPEPGLTQVVLEVELRTPCLR